MITLMWYGIKHEHVAVPLQNQQAPTDVMIWPEVSGNGLPTGTNLTPVIIHPWNNMARNTK